MLQAPSSDFRSSVGCQMIRVPAGSFLLGSPESESGRRSWEQQREVTLASHFYLAKTPVTQEQYAAALSNNVQLVLMLSSMLHSIGVGNMLPSWVRVVCVDINPAVVTKLSDRGSQQTVGVVTDVGLFLHRLAEALRS